MNQPALIIVDVQQGLDDPSWGTRNNPHAEQIMARLLDEWRKKRLPVVHIQHRSTAPGSPLSPSAPGYAFKPDTAPRPGEAVFTKSVNSAFIGTDLEDYLRNSRINSVVIVGLTTDHCVSTTARMAGNLGFEVWLVSDGTATFDREDINGRRIGADEIHNVHLASLHREFCTVVTSDQVMAKIAHDHSSRDAC